MHSRHSADNWNKRGKDIGEKSPPGYPAPVPAIVPAPANSQALANYADLIITELAAAKAAVGTWAMHVVEAGRLLNEMQDHAGHGNWGALLKEIGISTRTASDYMAMAGAWGRMTDEERQHAADLSSRGFLSKYVSKPPALLPPDVSSAPNADAAPDKAKLIKTLQSKVSKAVQSLGPAADEQIDDVLFEVTRTRLAAREIKVKIDLPEKHIIIEGEAIEVLADQDQANTYDGSLTATTDSDPVAPPPTVDDEKQRLQEEIDALRKRSLTEASFLDLQAEYQRRVDDLKARVVAHLETVEGGGRTFGPAVGSSQGSLSKWIGGSLMLWPETLARIDAALSAEGSASAPAA